MENKLKYILGIIVAIIVLIVVGYFVFNKSAKVTHSTSNTETVTTDKITTEQNTFTVEQVAQIKRVLTDSLKHVYGAIIKGLSSRSSSGSSSSEEDTVELSPFSYISEIDSNFVVKDDSGSVTDLFKVRSTFISPVLLAENSLHLLKINHTSFTKSVSTQTKTADTVFVETSKSFWERLTISPNISAGYGLFHKQFDVYTGVGLSFEF